MVVVVRGILLLSESDALLRVSLVFIQHINPDLLSELVYCMVY